MICEDCGTEDGTLGYYRGAVLCADCVQQSNITKFMHMPLWDDQQSRAEDREEERAKASWNNKDN